MIGRTSMIKPKVVVFTCNWNPYSSMESAGAGGARYPASIRPIRLMCLGRLPIGAILKAFEKGADGVLMLGCPPGECHYEFGNERAQEVFDQAKQLASMLGVRDEQLQLDWIAAGEGDTFAARVEAFVARLTQDQ